MTLSSRQLHSELRCRARQEVQTQQHNKRPGEKHNKRPGEKHDKRPGENDETADSGPAEAKVVKLKGKADKAGPGLTKTTQH